MSKCQFTQAKVTFPGFRLSEKGYQVDGAITEAVSRFPTQATRTGLHSFVRLANQLSAIMDSIAMLIAPLRLLLSTKNEFMWTANHDQSFSQAKKMLTSTPILTFFDPSKPTQLSTDTSASRQGLGFVFQQQQPDKSWTLVQAGSRFLTDAESQYAVIELELSTISWTGAKCKIFLAGLQHFSHL